MKKGPFGSAITKDMFIPKGKNSIKVYEQKNAIQKSELLGEYYISQEYFEKLKQFEVFEDDIIVSCAGTIGEIFRIPKNSPKGIINQALMKIKVVDITHIPYFMVFFDYLIKQQSKENSKGSAIKNIPPLDILKTFLIPLPPLKEQEEIVEVLDELISLASEFDRIKEELKRIEKRIEKSVLKLAIEGNLSKLYRASNPNLSATREIEAYNQNIQERRKAVNKELKTLDSKQDKEKIKKLKDELAKLKEIKILEDSAPFEIPKSWAWVKLGEVCEIQSGYTPKNNELNSQIGVPYFKVSDMNLPENQTYMLKTTLFSKNQKLKVYKSGSIIFPKNGGAVFTNKKRILTMDSIVDLNTSVLTPYFLIGLNYLYYFMLSIDLGKFTKGTALPTIDSASFNNTPIPLPPLKEQEKIVKVLDKLFILKENLRVE